MTERGSACPAFAKDTFQLFGCRAHARRGFFEAQEQEPKAAGWIFNRIGAMTCQSPTQAAFPSFDQLPVNEAAPSPLTDKYDNQHFLSQLPNELTLEYNTVNTTVIARMATQPNVANIRKP